MIDFYELEEWEFENITSDEDEKESLLSFIKNKLKRGIEDE